jgi:hypothetical protein
MVAGLCVITSGLILIFVYFMSMSLTPLNRAPTTDAAGRFVTHTSPTSPTASPTLSAASPTPFPGQQYIDTVQLASEVNPRTAQPTVPATTFKVKQRMYVTFAIHPAGHLGVVCVLWFLNSKQFSSFLLSPVGPNSLLAFSYTNVPSAPGSGYVQLYWGYAHSCADPTKLLAQRVNFTVIG